MVQVNSIVYALPFHFFSQKYCAVNIIDVYLYLAVFAARLKIAYFSTSYPLECVV